jgi:chromate transporter
LAESFLAPPAKPTPWRQLLTWFSIGFQSFGGGVATLTLIQTSIVQRLGWISEEEFTHDWALCQLAPGVNLIAMAILIGNRVAGMRGVALAMIGLLTPSAAATILMSAVYMHFERSTVVQHMLQGVIPAVVGLGLYTTWAMGKSLLEESHKRGRATLVAAIALFCCIAPAAVFLPIPVAYMLLGSGAVFSVFSVGRAFYRREEA